VENQHRLVKDYRDLNQDEINLINEIKEHAEKTKTLTEKVWRVIQQEEEYGEGSGFWENDSERWCWIGRDHLQQGFMALTRAVAKPQSF